MTAIGTYLAFTLERALDFLNTFTSNLDDSITSFAPIVAVNSHLVNLCVEVDA